MPRAKIVSLHNHRGEAAAEAKKLQRILVIAREMVRMNPEMGVRQSVDDILAVLNIPEWAQSIRSEKDGFRKWAVMASENKEM